MGIPAAVEERDEHGQDLVERVGLIEKEVENLGTSLETMTALACHTMVELAQIIESLNALVATDRRRAGGTTLQTDLIETQINGMAKKFSDLRRNLGV